MVTFPPFAGSVIPILSIVWAENGEKMHFFKKNKKLLLTFVQGLLYYAHRNSGKNIKGKAPVAQLDRASDYGSEGLGFESLRACFLNPEAFGLKKMPVVLNETGFF